MTTTRRTSTGSSAAIAEALNTLNSRIEKTESDFIGHLQKVEDRLDQIVEITKTVAVLQQQSTQQTDQIVEMRTQFREAQSKTDSSISRIHTRLDEIINHQRDKLELYSKEIDIKIDNVRSKNELTQKSLEEKIEASKANVSHIDRELKQWLNRGVGAWAIFMLLFGGIQTGIWRWVDSIEKEKEAYVKQITVTSGNVEKHTQQLEAITKITTDNQTNIKRLEQIASDSDRQLELLRNTLKK